MKTVAFIPARKNSKRLPGKNIKKLNGLPLIKHSIEFARNLKFVDDIVISTDDKKIINMYKKSKIIKIFKRPKILSGDKAKTVNVVIYTAKKYEKKFSKIETIILLQPTSPFRSKKLIYTAFRNFIKYKKKNSIISVTKLNQEKKKSFLIKNKKLYYDSYKNKKKNSFYINGNFYISTLSFLKKYQSFFFKNKTLAMKLNFKPLSVDIDSIQDFRDAKSYIKQYKYKLNKAFF